MTSEGKIILVVDDDPDIRESVKMILEDASYRVAVASNGKEALDYMRGTDKLPSLILLDLAMPVMDGSGFRERQRTVREWSGIPVFVFTAATEVRSRTAGMEAAKVISKPFDIDSLRDAVASAVGGEAAGSSRDRL